MFSAGTIFNMSDNPVLEVNFVGMAFKGLTQRAKDPNKKILAFLTKIFVLKRQHQLINLNETTFPSSIVFNFFILFKVTATHFLVI